MAKKNISAMGAFRVAFGIFMVLVYLGMAYLLITNFFDWDNTPLWLAVRYGLAAVFGVYGLWRGYRQVAGLDYYRLRQDDPEDEEDRISELIKNVHEDEEVE